MTRMKKLFLLAAICLFAARCFAQTAPKAIYYFVSFPNAVHHEAEIVMTVPQTPATPFRFRMSRSSAGRYATHEFGKNISDVKATDVDGNPLEIKQIEGDLYEITEHPETVKISYTLYADWTDGTYACIDESHAHLNMPAVFIWALGFNDADKSSL